MTSNDFCLIHVTQEVAGTSLVVQQLRLRTPNAGGPGSIPGRGTKIPHTATKPTRLSY